VTGVLQKSLVLILARDLADKLASAAFVVDHEGRLVYFNETAAEILGETFGEAGEMPMETWANVFAAVDQDGGPLSPDELPLVTALKQRSPTHRVIRIRTLDGKDRDLAVTALPLFARADEMVGAVALFWEHPSPGDSGSDTGVPIGGE
jgi:PAS domain-containing protein